MKIDNKIVLKLNDVKVTDSKKYTQDMINLHKTILTTFKILNIFEKITLNNINLYQNKIDQITLKHNILALKSNFLNFKSVINPNIKHSYINFIYIKIPKYDLLFKNTVVNLNFLKNKIIANARAEFNHSLLKIKATLNNRNKLTINIKTSKLKTSFFINTYLKKPELTAYIDLNYFYYKIKGKTDYLQLVYNNKIIKSEDLNLYLDNSKIIIRTKKLSFPNFENIKNINFKNLYCYYYINDNFIYLSSSGLKAQYKYYSLLLKNIEAIYKNKNNYNIVANNIILNDKKDNFNIITQKILVNKLHKFFKYTLQTNSFKNSFAYLNSKKIFGNLVKVFTNKIEGKIYKFDTEFNNINVNIKNKTVNIKNASINNVNFNNITYNNDILKVHSDTLLNTKVKELLKYFLKIDIPLLQIAGTNNIVSFIKISQNIQTATSINLKNSLFKLFDLDLLINEGDLDISNDKMKFNVTKSKLFLNKNLPIEFNATGKMNFLKMLMSIKGRFNFNIENILNLKDYNETLVFDFNKSTMFAKNSSLLIDFKKEMIILNQLKNILKYTPFYMFFKDGLLLITYNKNININSYLLLKLPILCKHLNKKTELLANILIDKIFLNINVKNNDINIKNKNLSIDINNTDISAHIHNLDINLQPLESILYSENKNNKDFNFTVKLFTNNANLIYGTHKFLSQHASIYYKNNQIKFHSIYKHSSIKGYTKNNYFLLEGKHFTNEEFKPFLPSFNFFKKINLDFILVKSPDNFYTGKIYLNKAIIKELKTLNNIIAFINTIPSLLSFSSPGFSSKGYKINKGFVNYLLYKKILYVKDAKIYGDNLDFFAKGYIDFNKNYIFLKVKANLKMKLKKIPIIGKGLSYLLFGKDGSIDIKMIVKGDINNPTVKEDIGKDILLSPFKLFKRAITLPFNLF